MTLREFIVKKLVISRTSPETFAFDTTIEYRTFWDLVEIEHNGVYYGSVANFLKIHPEYLVITKLDRYLYENNQ